MKNLKNQFFLTGVLKTIKLQLTFTAIFFVCFYFFLNESSFISAVVGYTTSLVASGFFFIQFLILKLARFSSVVFLCILLFGEIIKILFLLISLYLIGKNFIILDWFYVILGLILSLKLNYMNIFIHN